MTDRSQDDSGRQMTETHGETEEETSQAAHHGHSGGGHDKHAGHSVAMFRDRFWLSLLLSVPVLFFSEMIQEWFGYTAPTFPGSDWIAPVLGTVIFIYGGAPFLKGAAQEARDRQPGMMLLIGMAITVAFVASAATTLGWFDLEFWWELAALITIMLLGHWMEMRARRRAKAVDPYRRTRVLPLIARTPGVDTTFGVTAACMSNVCIRLVSRRDALDRLIRL